jgi:hypothetical protein
VIVATALYDLKTKRLDGRPGRHEAPEWPPCSLLGSSGRLLKAF